MKLAGRTIRPLVRPPVRRGAVALVSAGAAAATLVTGAPPASASIYAAGGAWGPYTATTTATCKYSVYARTGVLTTTVAPPRVWARNRHAGAGNDAAWIRYRVFLVNAYTGRTVTATGYSGWARATDVTAARFSGASALSADWRGNYVVDYRIEWWNSTSQIGWAADRVHRYNYVNQYNVGPFGPFSSCYRP